MKQFMLVPSFIHGGARGLGKGWVRPAHGGLLVTPSYPVVSGSVLCMPPRAWFYHDRNPREDRIITSLCMSVSHTGLKMSQRQRFGFGPFPHPALLLSGCPVAPCTAACEEEMKVPPTKESNKPLFLDSTPFLPGGTTSEASGQEALKALMIPESD